MSTFHFTQPQKITACFCSLTATSTLGHLVEKNMFFKRGHQSRVDICSNGHQKVGTVVFNHGPWKQQLSILINGAVDRSHNKAKWAAEVSGSADSCASMDGGWDELQQISERNAYQNDDGLGLRQSNMAQNNQTQEIWGYLHPTAALTPTRKARWTTK